MFIIGQIFFYPQMDTDSHRWDSKHSLKSRLWITNSSF